MELENIVANTVYLKAREGEFVDLKIKVKVTTMQCFSGGSDSNKGKRATRATSGKPPAFQCCNIGEVNSNPHWVIRFSLLKSDSSGMRHAALLVSPVECLWQLINLAVGLNIKYKARLTNNKPQNGEKPMRFIHSDNGSGTRSASMRFRLDSCLGSTSPVDK
ncbi:hypothetical protein NQ317_013868 [Molorchus minor]|uniref:Uncharacterized protein n=1 Tax=Molorchus minor TaxID=1323400 RepID=A0ABQ9K6P9_9CUCU|nr:hypothetical protein NQ317_013868 [Molorchus minor]